MTGIVTAATVLIGLGGLCVLVESLFYLPPGVKVVAAVVCLAPSVLLMIWGGLLFLKRRGLDEVAMIVERGLPQLNGRLIGVLQLWRLRDGSPEGYSPALIDAAVVQAEETSQNFDFLTAIDRRTLNRSKRIFGMAIALVTVGFLLNSGPAYRAFLRCLHPMTIYHRPPDTLLTVTPGNVRVFMGKDVTIGITMGGKIPTTLTLLHATMGDDRWEPIVLTTGGRDSVGYRFREVKASFRYRVKAGYDESDVFAVEVVDHPVVQKVTATYRPPLYTGMATTTEEGGDLRGVVGTQVTLEAWANKPLRAATIVTDASSEVPCRVTGRLIQADLTILKNMEYHFAIIDLGGIPDPEPITYQVEAIPDERPSVEIVEPGEDTDLTEDMVLPLRVEAGDDFRVSRLQLLYRMNDGRETKVESLPLPADTRGSFEVEYRWDLKPLSLLPGDRVTYLAEVYDNDGIVGPKRARSREFTVRFPTIEEIFKAAEEQQAGGIVGMEAMIEEGKRLKEQLERVSRDMLKERQLEWAQKKEVQAAIEKQQRMAEEMKALASKIGETVNRLEQSGLVTMETIQKLEEVRKLMLEVATPELLRSMERLRQAMESLSPDEIRRAMKDFALNQEEFQKRLDRTLSVLKRLQVEQRLEAAVKRAGELLARQERINQHLEDPLGEEDRERLAGEEEGLREELQRLGNDLEALKEQMTPMPEMPGAEIGKIGERIERGETLRRMERMAGQLRAGQISTARAGGKQNAEDLTHLLSELRRIQSSMIAAQKAQISKEVKEIISDLLYLSKRQEGVAMMGPAQGSEAEEQQSLLSGTSKVANRLFNTAQKTLFISPEVGQAVGRSLAEMEKAMRQLEGGRSSSSVDHQHEAMASLNEAVVSLRRAMEAMASAQSAMGFSEMVERMQGLSARQQLINQGTEALHGGGLSMEERALMARLAAEQEAVRRSVDEMARGVRGGSGIRARLEELEREMREVIRDLSHRHVDPKTIQRQERILSRMLDAMRSIHERDEEKRRRAEVGRDRPYSGPLSLPEGLGEKRDLLREELEKALKAGYGKRDQEVIRRYFESLMKKGESVEE